VRGPSLGAPRATQCLRRGGARPTRRRAGHPQRLGVGHVGRVRRSVGSVACASAAFALRGCGVCNAAVRLSRACVRVRRPFFRVDTRDDLTHRLSLCGGHQGFPGEASQGPPPVASSGLRDSGPHPPPRERSDPHRGVQGTGKLDTHGHHVEVRGRSESNARADDACASTCASVDVGGHVGTCHRTTGRGVADHGHEDPERPDGVGVQAGGAGDPGRPSLLSAVVLSGSAVRVLRRRAGRQEGVSARIASI